MSSALEKSLTPCPLQGGPTLFALQEVLVRVRIEAGKETKEKNSFFSPEVPSVSLSQLYSQLFLDEGITNF